jgi:hypothetical protein
MKLFTALLIYLQISLFATNYYVSNLHPLAADSNPGTENLPFKTIQKGINVALAGDTVFVKPGIYPERLTMQRSGTASNPIVISAFDFSAKPIIEAAGIVTSKIINWGSVQKHFIHFTGFEVRNAQEWAIWVEGNDNQIMHCKVYNVLRSGISIITGDRNVISYNEVFNIGNVALNKIGNSIHIEARPDRGLTANDNIVEYNVLYDNASHFGVNIFPEAAGVLQTQMRGNIIRNNYINACLGGIYTRYQTNFKIYNNVILNSLDNGIWFHINANAPTSANTFNAYGEIYNNTVYGSENRGINNTTSNYLKIKNNLFIDNGRTSTGGQEHIRIDKLIGHEIDCNLYYGLGKWRWGTTIYSSLSAWRTASGQDSLSLTTNPLVKSISALDFSLTSGSPAINKGENLNSLFTIDYRGVPRPQGNSFDIGAYEYVDTVLNQINLNIRIFLQGPFNNGEMNTSLSALGLLPQAQPFNGEPWNYNGLETISNNVSPDIVDWMLIEIRSGVAASSVVYKRACLLKKNGDLVSLDGVTPLSVTLPQGNYYVILRHRNHLAVMSSIPVPFSSPSVNYDFTNSPSKAYGLNPVFDLGNNMYGMVSGDGDASGGVGSNDLNGVWRVQNGNVGYLKGDFNLSGGVSSSDRNSHWRANNGRVSQVPGN